MLVEVATVMGVMLGTETFYVPLDASDLMTVSLDAEVDVGPVTVHGSLPTATLVMPHDTHHAVGNGRIGARLVGEAEVDDVGLTGWVSAGVTVPLATRKAGMAWVATMNEDPTRFYPYARGVRAAAGGRARRGVGFVDGDVEGQAARVGNPGFETSASLVRLRLGAGAKVRPRVEAFSRWTLTSLLLGSAVGDEPAWSQGLDLGVRGAGDAWQWGARLHCPKDQLVSADLKLGLGLDLSRRF
jgi:hypothetical protein